MKKEDNPNSNLAKIEIADQQRKEAVEGFHSK